ncbi:MAG: beta family protein [Ignavibacteria bacterium]|nr:beta family protein [Ignavibacteria bacterium]
MINTDQYVPILKCKEGEFQALKRLDSSIKSFIVPIVDLVRNKQKKLDPHILSSIGYILKHWSPERLLFIDGYMIQEDGVLQNGMHPIEYIFNELLSKRFNVLPSISNITGLDYNAAIKSVCQEVQKGVCIRIFRRPTNQINFEIDRLLNYLELSPIEVDLVIDLRSLEDIGSNELSQWCSQELNNLNYLAEWRSFVISGGSFPVDLTELKQDQIHLIDRKEWMNWKRLVERKEVERIPVYSDYAISHPLMSPFEGIPNASASIRYTQENEFYVYRGKGTRQYSFDQFYDLSESLINSEEYYGQDHCDGEKFIHICGTKKEKPGSLTTWRWVGTVHHLTVVTNQLRQFFRDFNA